VRAVAAISVPAGWGSARASTRMRKAAASPDSIKSASRPIVDALVDCAGARSASSRRAEVSVPASRGGCFVKLGQSTTPRVVGEVPEILVRMRLLSHQMEVFGASVMVVSHDLLMHLSLDRFVKQTSRKAGKPSTASRCPSHQESGSLE